MSREVRLTARARHDLSRLERFLVEKNPDAARQAVDATAGAIQSLADHAERGHQARDPIYGKSPSRSAIPAM
jgi:plasmid stabilization system protein ParE